MKPLRAEDIELALCEPRDKAFTAEGWWFELKLDGFRLLAERIGGKVRLVLRRGREATLLFPEVVAALEAVPGPDFILDGEVVIQDAAGHPDFHRLLSRHTLSNPHDIERQAKTNPAVYFAFDCLRLGERDVRELPLRDRKALLMQLIDKRPSVIAVDHVETQGDAFLEVVAQQQLEGVVAKKADAPYRGGRHPNWLKVALKSVGDFAVVGFAEDWGALFLAAWDGHRFTYAGKVGSGFNPNVAQPVRPILEAAVRKTPAFDGAQPDDADAVWVEPSVVVEVRYKSWPVDKSLREPTFLRFRDDKTIHECPPAPWAKREAPAEPSAPEATVSNAKKVFFPADGLTKGDVFRYYQDVSPWLLPYLVNRPLMLTRYPDGITGKSFFQKAKPLKAPAFIRTVRVRTDEDRRELDQLVCDDLRTLEWCAAMGAIPLHLPAGRVDSLDRADWAVIDFDPKEAPFAHVIELARGLDALCREAKLPAFVKTSGSSGLHVLVPLGRQLDHAGARQLADLLAALLVKRYPSIATVERVVKKRDGKVYIDTSSNGQGKLLASPLCVRPVPGAPVSMPLNWAEVKPGLTPRQFTIRDAVARLRDVSDPMQPVLTLSPDLGSALAALS